MSQTSIAQQALTSFPNFYTNRAILSIANKPRWAVSDTNKRPIDIPTLTNPDPEFARVVGVREITNGHLVTLPELTNIPIEFRNNAYYLRANIDNILVLDIEPSCPTEIRDQLLRLPYLYAETSMSGKGFHLIMPLPDNYHDYPNATAKKKLQEPHKYYEIIIEHWITFTRSVLLPTIQPQNFSNTTWEKVYASLAIEAKPTIKTDIDMDNEKPSIPHEPEIVNIITQMYSSRQTKSLTDFNGDHSRYEFSVLGSLRYHLENTIIASQFNDHKYSNIEKAWLIYLAIQNIIEPRDKHEQYREGLPILLYSAINLINSQRKD